MNSKKSKNKITAELKAIKLPYFKCEHSATLKDTTMHELFKNSFGSKYLKYTPAVPQNGANAAVAEKIALIDSDYKTIISSTEGAIVKTYLPIVYAPNFKYVNFSL